MDLPLRLDRASGEPLQRQLVEQLRAAMLGGALSAGARLPSTRALARELGVSRNLVVAAYDELYADGYVEGRHGSGTYVARDLPVLPRPTQPPIRASFRWLRAAEPPELPTGDGPACAIAFRLGQPSVQPLPLDVWRSVWRAVTDRLPPSEYAPPGGDPELRLAVARYLGRARGLPCRAEDVVITAGAIQAIDLIAQTALRPGDPVGFEEPGYPAARAVLAARGATIVPIPVDDDGLRVDQLPRGQAAPLLVYVTPSHQYPLGARLSFPRRLALLEWAREHDSLIVEDDYDSEIRFDAPPLPALAALADGGPVAYIGTFSKLLSPALRIGYVVAPPPLRQRLERLKRLTDYHTSWPVQRALAAFVGSGHLERHVRRMRREYARKRAALAGALAPVAHLARPVGLEAGLHCCLLLRPDLDPVEVAARARERGVGITTLAGYAVRPPEQPGVLLGYGGLSLADVERGARILADVIARVAGEQQTP